MPQPMQFTQPTVADVHINTALSNISLAYLQDTRDYIATQVFPRVPVMNQSNFFFEFQRDAFFRTDAEERAPGTESPGTGFNLIQRGPYYARIYNLHWDIPDEVRANADSVLSLDAAGTTMLTQQMAIKRDVSFLNTYFATGVWSGIALNTEMVGVTASPGANQFLRWDQAGSTPMEDVRLAALKIKAKTGLRPNVLVLGPYVTNSLINNPEIVDRIKYTQRGFLDLDLLATAFGVDKVVSAEAVLNSAVENATLAMDFVFGKSALLVYAAPAPGILTASAGYTFEWQNAIRNTTNMTISKWYKQSIHSDRLEIFMNYDMQVIAPDMGIFFQNAVS